MPSDDGEPLSREQPRIYRDPWYEFDEGATFTLAVDDGLRRTVSGFVSECHQIELSVTEASLLLSGVDRSKTYAYAMVVQADRFDSFDVATPGYLTFFDGPLTGTFDILDVADTGYDSPSTLRADSDSVEFESPDGEYGARLPTQSRYGVSSESPPGTDAGIADNFDDAEHVVATLDDHSAALYEAAERYVSEGALRYAELATDGGDAWLTFTDGEDGRLVRLAPSDGAGHGLYPGAEFYDAICRALSVSDNAIEIEWADDNPAIIAGSADGIEFNAYVAPRIPRDDNVYWPTATATEAVRRW